MVKGIRNIRRWWFELHETFHLLTSAAADVEITPERALMIKRALVRQYAHQNNLEVTGWTSHWI